MAKPPPGILPLDPIFVKKVEDWLDARIPDKAEQFTIRKENVERVFPSLTDNDWSELENRYRAAGWTIVSSSYWVSRENDGGPYFYLSKF